MFGSRSVPPAIGMALALSPSRMRAASSSVRGARNSKRGRRIMARAPFLSRGEAFTPGNIIHRVAVATFPWRRNAQSFRPIDVREMDWSKTRVASRFLFGEGFHDFFRSDGDFIDPHTDSVVDGVGNRRHDRQKRALTN